MTELQPFLHDAIVLVKAPDICVCGRDGAIRSGADGLYHGDRRALSRLEFAVDGVAPTPIQAVNLGANAALFLGVVRGLGEHGPDPAVTVEVRRRLTGGVLTDTVTVTNSGRATVSCQLQVHAGCDLADMSDVKSGRAGTPVAASAGTDGLDWIAGPDRVRLAAEPAPSSIDAADGTLGYALALEAGTHFSCTLRIQPPVMHADADWAAFTAGGSTPWQPVQVTSADDRLARLVQVSLDDLAALRLQDSADEPSQFLGAGAPWYLTLFGRDSLWAARMLLPLGTDLAVGTLRALARLQGTSVDPETGEQPGKIVHEIRKEQADHGGGTSLPPRYYGTIDATPLWINTLVDAWRWGLPDHSIAPLLPNLEAALAWMIDYGDADGDGFLEYIDLTGRGLANQGWKDSMDSIRWQSGELATAPLALCEVQAYAYEAAVGGAALLRACGRSGSARYEDWAGALQRQFRQRFWVDGDSGRYPALALDADKRPVDAVTSSLGHLLGTGLLDDAETALVAERLGRPSLDSGFGLRTLSSEAVGYNPIGYHTGSIWPHDTAIAVHGLARTGHYATALSLAQGLVAAATSYDYRLPELYAGRGKDLEPAPAPYPASCRPQAWSAAAAILVLQAILGLEADMPNGRLQVAPLPGAPYLPISVNGLRVGGAPLSVRIDADGAAHVSADTAVRIITHGERDGGR